jgi:hypothetical protein
MSTQTNGIDPNTGTEQKSWFHTEAEFQDSFKFWFALMWQNKYIQLFVLGFVITIVELCKFMTCCQTVAENWNEDGALGGIMTIMGLFIAPTIAGAISYAGFYKYWEDIKAIYKKP